MKKILIVAMVLMMGVVFAQNRFEIALSTIDPDTEIVVTEDTLAYADTNEHAFTLTNTQAYVDLYYWKDYVCEIKVYYNGNPNDVNLTIGYASSNQSMTAALAITQLDTDYWTTEVIDLDTAGDTTTDYILLDGGTLNGRYLYLKYQYSGDPGNDPIITVYLNKI